ncbi:MAG TPA: alpha/beta hydrolase [Telluria sp.]|nr:alpha/beta hydrolase [Telluria sp.]
MSMRDSIFIRWMLGLALAAASLGACAQGQVFKVATRPEVTTGVFWQARDGATATVLLIPGGGGGFGKVEDGKPSSPNFLVRGMQYFLANGFNVAIFGKPSDTADLDYPDRVSDQHMADLRAVLDFVKQQSAAPVWIVGTSRGTVSATAAAIRIQDPRIAGLVLTSSVVSYKKVGAVPRQDLAAIRLPVLVVHNSRDACSVCNPAEVPAILSGLKNAAAKKLVMIDAGANPSGAACGALHWHGFIGAEKETVDVIGGWIRAESAR